jgi:hypothetical protein
MDQDAIAIMIWQATILGINVFQETVGTSILAEPEATGSGHCLPSGLFRGNRPKPIPPKLGESSPQAIKDYTGPQLRPSRLNWQDWHAATREKIREHLPPIAFSCALSIFHWHWPDRSPVRLSQRKRNWSEIPGIFAPLSLLLSNCGKLDEPEWAIDHDEHTTLFGLVAYVLFVVYWTW